jgi:RNA polymerase sigma-70 factor (ECF subfamily)
MAWPAPTVGSTDPQLRMGRNERKEPLMGDIHQHIEAEIPCLRRYARVLMRNSVAADDLIQECLLRGLAKRHLWQEGTNLRGWLSTIMHNQYVNGVRRSIRAGMPVELCDDDPLLSMPANQHKSLELRDLDRAIGRLPADQRAVILLVGLEGMTYVDAGKVLGIPVGTVRSRLSRGRDALRELMMGTSAGRIVESRSPSVTTATCASPTTTLTHRRQLNMGAIAARLE